MTRLNVDNISHTDGTSSVNFPDGFSVGGTTFTPTFTKTSSASEPASPASGDFWYDSANDKAYFYVVDAWVEILKSGA